MIPGPADWCTSRNGYHFRSSRVSLEHWNMQQVPQPAQSALAFLSGNVQWWATTWKIRNSMEGKKKFIFLIIICLVRKQYVHSCHFFSRETDSFRKSLVSFAEDKHLWFFVSFLGPAMKERSHTKMVYVRPNLVVQGAWNDIFEGRIAMAS